MDMRRRGNYSKPVIHPRPDPPWRSCRVAHSPQPGGRAVKELMASCYKAIIEAREHEVQGWTRAGTLLLADGNEIEMAPLDQAQQLGGIIWRVARLKCGGWGSEGAKSCLIDGESLSTAISRAKGQAKGLEGRVFRTLSQLFKELDTFYPSKSKGALAYSIPPGGANRLMRIVGVAWSEDRMSAGQDPFYLPILLRRFEFLASRQRSVTAEGDFPEYFFTEYFFTCAEAAKYAGVSERTIKNWKKRGWLKVDQDGRKIRIARADLDKCRKGQ